MKTAFGLEALVGLLAGIVLTFIILGGAAVLGIFLFKMWWWFLLWAIAL